MSETAQTRPADIAHAWWAALSSEESPHGRTALARLRRGHTPLEIMSVPETIALITRLPRFDPDSVATLAGVLAYVRSDADASLPRALGPGGIAPDASAKLSQARFRRLLQCERGELLQQLRRVVQLADGVADVRGVATAVLYWGDRIRRQWIYEYYGVAEDWRRNREASASGPETHQETHP